MVPVNLLTDPMSENQKKPYQQQVFSLSNRLLRTLWGLTSVVLFRWSPRPFHGWRSFLLRCFGAKLGPSCHIYPRAQIWAPWKLECEEGVAIADEAIVYNPTLVFLGSHAVVSQQAYLCGASHDCDDPLFPLISASIFIKPYAWVCARATVQMGVTIGEGAVLGQGAIATRDLEPWSVYAGVPARKLRNRGR